MEDRVRAALSVRPAPAADPEPEAFAEAPGLRIPFVHVGFADAAGLRFRLDIGAPAAYITDHFIWRFQMKVRPISLADLDVWTALRHELWPRHSMDDLRREGVELFRRSDTAFFCAEERGEWLGIAEASLRSPERGHLEGWYVKPEHRRRGVGRALVGAVEAWCISRGCTVLGSDTDGDYPVSPAAHRALGFREDGSPLLFRKELGTCADAPRHAVCRKMDGRPIG